MSTEKIWKCKVGGVCGDLTSGADFPMRAAIAKAFKETTGSDSDFIFSGWAAELTEGERAVHENREPSAEYYAKFKLEAAAPDLLEKAKAVLAWWDGWMATQLHDDALEAAEWDQFFKLRTAIERATT
jgi:hypothetical protein